MKFSQWIGLIALVVSLYILWQIREVLLLVFAAVVLATVLNRLVRYLRRWHLGRSSAVLLSLGLLIALLVFCFLLIVPPLAGQFRQLTVLVPRGFGRLNVWSQQLESYVPGSMQQYLPDVSSLTDQVQPFTNLLLGRSFAFLSNSLSVVLHLLLMVFVTVMLLFDPQPYRKAFVRMFPSFYRRRVDGILDQCEVVLEGWLIGVLFNMTVIGVFSCIGLLILGIRAPLAQGVLAGLLMFIPNIGPTISVVPPMIIALLDAPWKSLVVLALYIGSHVLESHVLTPLVMARQVSLLPAATLLAQVFFATFFGFLGLILALPLTVVGQVWLKEVVIKDILDQWRDNASEAKPEALSSLLPKADHSEADEADPASPSKSDTSLRNMTATGKPIVVRRVSRKGSK